VPHDEHGNFCPVLTLIPDLFRNEFILRKTLDFSGPKLPPLLTFLQGVVETILVKERRVGEARKGDEEPRVLSFAPDGGLSDELWSEPSDAFSILEIVDVNLVFDLSWHRSISCSLFFFFDQRENNPRTSLLYTMTRWSLTKIPISSFASFCSGTRSFRVNFGSAISIVMIFSRGASLLVNK